MTAPVEQDAHAAAAVDGLRYACAAGSQVACAVPSDHRPGWHTPPAQYRGVNAMHMRVEAELCTRVTR